MRGHYHHIQFIQDLLTQRERQLDTEHALHAQMAQREREDSATVQALRGRVGALEAEREALMRKEAQANAHKINAEDASN